jgi:hypothetical protein
VQALDARGSVVPGVTIRFAAQGGRFQGNVDSAGVVRGGAPGTVPIAITALAPNGRPHVEKIEVRIVAGPAARITVSPSVTRMLAGQRLQLDATVLAASGDARDDAVTWTSSNTNVLTFAGGLLTAVGPGTATITARAGQAVASLTTQVISSSGVTVSISPERASGRQVTLSVSPSMHATQRASASLDSPRRGALHLATVPSATTARSWAISRGSTS